MDVSPTKRRVLAPLDANAQSPASIKTSKLGQGKPLLPRDRNSPTKRSVDAADESAPKRQRILASSLDPAMAIESTPAKQDRDCSASPEPSSVFDNSIVDTSQATCATEPDTDALVPSPPRPPRRPTITREEARQKAEILRLRLGLAGYKLRTGQENVPLERLEVRRAPNDRREALPRHLDHGGERGEHATVRADSQRSKLPMPRSVSHSHPSPEKNLLPRLYPASFSTPTRNRLDEEEGLTSSAIKGGAAKGLLSLSRS
ncbi:hypothetical protein AB5N19_04292 [Seiridium cardinale]